MERFIGLNFQFSYFKCYESFSMIIHFVYKLCILKCLNKLNTPWKFSFVGLNPQKVSPANLSMFAVVHVCNNGIMQVSYLAF